MTRGHMIRVQNLHGVAHAGLENPMNLRRLLLPASVITAVGVPIAMHQDGFESVKQGVATVWRTDSSPQDETDKTNVDEIRRLSENPLGDLDPQDQRTPVEGARVSDLSEVLRFDVTPIWVMQRWPRVTTHLASLDLEGFRVPLVTGTQIHDLAGSLTYYFDKNQTVQRITFFGYTGDETRLVELMTSKCGMRAEPTLGRGLYLTKWSGKPKSALRIRHGPIVRAGAGRLQLEVELELNRPGRGYELSETFAASLAEEQRVGRW